MEIASRNPIIIVQIVPITFEEKIRKFFLSFVQLVSILWINIFIGCVCRWKRRNCDDEVCVSVASCDVRVCVHCALCTIVIRFYYEISLNDACQNQSMNDVFGLRQWNRRKTSNANKENVLCRRWQSLADNVVVIIVFRSYLFKVFSSILNRIWSIACVCVCEWMCLRVRMTWSSSFSFLLMRESIVFRNPAMSVAFGFSAFFIRVKWAQNEN